MQFHLPKHFQKSNNKQYYPSQMLQVQGLWGYYGYHNKLLIMNHQYKIPLLQHDYPTNQLKKDPYMYWVQSNCLS